MGTFRGLEMLSTTTLAVAATAYAAKKAYNYSQRVPISGVALVTGSAGGLGFQLCVELILKGIRAVCVVDLRQSQVDEAVERLQTIATELRKKVLVTGFVCNVADVDMVKEMARKVEAEVGYVDILINNAGIVS